MRVALNEPDREAGFVLHERLAADTWRVTDLPLCRVLLMNNACWPWLILVPRRAGAVEMHRLDPADQQTLMTEIALVSTLMEQRFYPDKLNVAAIGNIVPQLHVHIVARTRDDPAWPGPVWGSGHARAYDPHTGRDRLAALAAALAPLEGTGGGACVMGSSQGLRPFPQTRGFAPWTPPKAQPLETLR